MNEWNQLAAALEKLGCRVETGQSLKAEPCALTDGRTVSDAESARQWLAEILAGKPTGWVQFSDANVWMQAGHMYLGQRSEKTPDQDELVKLADDNRRPRGVPLAAELVIGVTSHHLRHDGARWITTRITREPADDAVIQHRTFPHSIQHLPDLAYEVAWTGSPLRPTAFRLTAQTSTSD